MSKQNLMKTYSNFDANEFGEIRNQEFNDNQSIVTIWFSSGLRTLTLSFDFTKQFLMVFVDSFPRYKFKGPKKVSLLTWNVLLTQCDNKFEKCLLPVSVS